MRVEKRISMNRFSLSEISGADVNVTTINVGLCAGRHDIPGVDEYIFPNTVDPMDFHGMKRQATRRLIALIRNTGRGQVYVLDEDDDGPCDRVYVPVDIRLYVTGLTPATIAVMQAFECLYEACQVHGLTLMHYDRESGQYREQEWKSRD